MQKYVVGFLFDERAENLVLIRKTKPDWQKGSLNGVGGKVEPGEEYLDAMVREFREETGIDFKEWELYTVMRNLEETNFPYEMYVYRAFVTPEILWSVRTTTEEEIVIINLEDLYQEKLISNLHWLVPLALDEIITLVEVKIKDPI